MYDDTATIDAILQHRTRQHPDHPVVRFPDTQVTYAELSDGSARVGTLIAGLGIEATDTVGVMLPNGPAFLETWFGLARLGVVEVPINTAYRGDILGYVLRQSRCRALVVHRRWLTRIAEVAHDLDDLAHVLVVDDGPATDQASGATSGPVGTATVTDYRRAVAASSPTLAPRRVEPRDHSVILYTSGTTGPSKGVVLSHNANFRLGRTMSQASGFGSGEVLFTAFPLFHVAARYVSVLAAMLVDGSVVVHDRFSASRFWDTCADEGVTAIHYLGSLLTMLLKQPEREQERDHDVRLAYGAGAPLPVAREVQRRFGLRLFELYGMTETGAVTMNRDGAWREGTCGTALPDSQVEVHDHRGRTVPMGVEGEIVVRPNEPHIMIEEYLGMPEATLEAFRDLWFHTGDRGSLDDDGFLQFAGRSKDAIRRRGENVSAWEVEVVVADHPDVAACAVIGVADEISGEEVMAVLVMQPGRDMDPVVLLDHCQERLPYFAVPRYLTTVESLPMNTSKRVEKYKLRDSSIVDDAWDREAHDYQIRR